ncbi:sel1 repeat family protein [Fulvimonas sp. R45]|uniref:sel1 repeat family protein n=1 Tax=Fulvimonas sp. R45 TaxID=3045937 RepID=UPI00265EEA7D|nr:sel1 repeat family protein [Fulvimonas sp. R45]MDO1530459.1 sel1 repeat family protein [Fulvimonas sp. R45]
MLLDAFAVAHADRAADTSVHATDAASAGTGTPPPPRSNPKIQGILEAMDHASTWGHPDLFGQFAGMRNLFAGKYQDALKYFKYGARYADKLSQLSIGMMYLHGRGVPKDLATACAWMTLASERNYPAYVQARDGVCAMLSTAQHDEAQARLGTLRREYGDDIAKQRMKLALFDAKRAFTGSHTGFDYGVRTAAATELDAMKAKTDCTGLSLFLGGVEVPREGCGTYDPALLDPGKYFAARDAQWYGTVTIGTLQKASVPAPGPGAPVPGKPPDGPDE